ncbi:MAG: hypothetical protein GWM98_09455, partial [Nitrospinaceae bacterium]|nr:hypothetical protein [Nitrospinaceae bacterium]NIR54678.1 hypothetical protein [Nitrospinaceae bacterium]NIS85095.1 hypothetical protein [Nitrospinaceae bacterium]NIT81912.1 hypothetical protein [Nitrospinaceae bacterium]NIU44176.1 hypothetical protein [Nitrospinaceae bacterium]
MKRLCVFIIVWCIFAGFSNPVWGNPAQLRAEPSLNQQMDWDLKPNGLLYVSYDLNHNGEPDYYTVRTLVRSYLSNQPVQVAISIYPDNPVFFVPYRTSIQVYIVSPEPLFYALDVDEDGHWDLMYKDVLEDGINGNERFYDSPSGMFADLESN